MYKCGSYYASSIIKMQYGQQPAFYAQKTNCGLSSMKLLLAIHVPSKIKLTRMIETCVKAAQWVERTTTEPQ
jgi:hypothetical protein